MPRFDKLLILDLDETLVYVSLFTLGRHPDFRVGMAEGVIRPGTKRFVTTCLERFTVGIWTSATADYAGDVISRIVDDPGKLAFIRTREHCVKEIDETSHDRFWVKDLGQLFVMGYKAESVIVVDDSPESWLRHRANVVALSKYKGDPADRELDALLQYLDYLGALADVRVVDKQDWRQWRSPG